MFKVSEVIRQLEHQNFFGSLEVKFEAGKIVLLRKTETIKPEYEDYRGTRGRQNDQPA